MKEVRVCVNHVKRSKGLGQSTPLPAAGTSCGLAEFARLDPFEQIIGQSYSTGSLAR
jgi:hypothetical protein